MDYDETAPVLAIVVDPDSKIALLGPMSLNVAGTVVGTIEGSIEALEIEGGSVLWMDESSKNRGLATNLLATKIAHRLNADLFPDDTINGRGLIAGETTWPLATSSLRTFRRPRSRRSNGLGSKSSRVRWAW